MLGESIREVLRNTLLESTTIISKYTNKTWLKRSLKNNNYEGPNGNQVVAYKWSWKWGLRYSEYEGGDVEVRVSDWDNAEQCTTCQRNIVHIFFVLNKQDDTVKPYGFDHVHKVLGIEKELSKTLLNKIKNSVTVPKGQKELSKVDENRLKAVFNIYLKASGKTPEEARQKLAHCIGPTAQVGSPLFYHRDDKRYVYLIGRKITPAVLKRVTVLVPEFRQVPKEEQAKLWIIDRGNQIIHKFARKTASEATMALMNAHSNVSWALANSRAQSSKYLWAVNIKDRLIMRVVIGSVVENPDFTKYFPDWELGGPELAKKFREHVQ